MYREFKDVLIELRTKSKMTQNELALKLGVVKSTIANYESGYRKPDNDTLIQLASLFNVSIDYLLGLDDTIPSTNQVTFDDFTYALYSETKDLTKEQKDALLQMAKALKASK